MLPVVDHMARQSVDGPVAASIIVDTTLKEHGWLRALAGNGLGASDAPWATAGVDFVGGEMYDRVAKNWRLEECVPPPQLAEHALHLPAAMLGTHSCTFVSRSAGHSTPPCAGVRSTARCRLWCT